MASGSGASSPEARAPETDGSGAVRLEELDRLAGVALVFQGYLLRRAWGVYYLIWSAALAGFFIIPEVLTGPLAPTTNVELVLYYAFLVAVIGLACWGTSWAFTQSARAARLRDTIEGRAISRRRFLQVLAVGFALAALVFGVSYVSSYAGLLVLDAALGGVVLWLLVQVRAWFRRPPPEAALAVATYATSVVGSAIALVLTNNQGLYAVLWLIATVGWAFSGAYALFHAAEEMTPDARP